ncbi:MAG: mechanosensitive ion channel, partial [Eubacteriales bacterium]
MSGLSVFLDVNLSLFVAFGIKVLLALVVFFVGRKVISWIGKIARRWLVKFDVDKGIQQFACSCLNVVLYFVLLTSIAAEFGLETTSIAALFASAGVAVGLALQGSLSNFAGGILILLLKPFVVGDYILEDTSKNEGVVIEIQLFYTKLQSVDNKVIVIPNGTLANASLTNITGEESRRLDL